MTETDEQKRKIAKLIKRLIIIASILIVISFIAPWLLTRFSILDLTETGQIGDTLGGIMNPFIAIAGVIVTYLAFYMQFKANQYQREQFEIQLTKEKEQFRQELGLQKEQFLKNQFENQFYEMLRVHRENVNDLSYKEVYIDINNFNGSYMKDNNIIGIKTFPFLLTEFEFCFKIVGENLIEADLKGQANEAYGIFWDGVKENDREKPNTFATALNYKNFLNKTILLGNSNQLAHYYRQLFQTVKFIVYQTIFTYEEKRKYIRILRSQLSNEEQVLLFYNWFSGFGKEWENENNSFLTDYRMIHNVFPNMLVDEIKLEEIFDINSGYKTELNREKDSLFEYQDWE
jgi:hypothetical protein